MLIIIGRDYVFIFIYEIILFLVSLEFMKDVEGLII